VRPVRFIPLVLFVLLFVGWLLLLRRFLLALTFLLLLLFQLLLLLFVFLFELLLLVLLLLLHLLLLLFGPALLSFINLLLRRRPGLDEWPASVQLAFGFLHECAPHAGLPFFKYASQQSPVETGYERTDRPSRRAL